MREIVLDTETTGLDPSSGHRIIEIGCVELIDGFKTGLTYHSYINPERRIDAGALAVHGISSDFLKDKRIFAEIIEELKDFIGDSSLVIHNAGFDMKFLRAEYKPFGYDEHLNTLKIVDTLQIARRKYPGAKADLNSLCKRFDIDLSSRDKHGALLDALLLADVYINMVYERQQTMNLSNETKIIIKTKEMNRIKREARKFQATQAEIDAHEQFLVKKVKNLAENW